MSGTPAAYFALTLYVAACGDAASSTPDADASASEDAGSSLTADAASSTPDADPPMPDAATATAGVSGNAFNFSSGGGALVGGVVTVLESPELTATTANEGVFSFAALPVGAETTFVLSYADYPPIQTGTHVMPPQGMERVSFQAPDGALYQALAAMLRLTPDPGRCQIASTVTRVGNSLYDDTPGTHGEPGSTVTLDPMPPDADGPVYFNLAKYNVIWPDRTLTETTADGGVLFLNVPEGEYILAAHKPDTDFRPVKVRCRAGFIANASPPWGLQAVSGGVGPRTSPDWQ